MIQRRSQVAPIGDDGGSEDSPIRLWTVKEMAARLAMSEDFIRARINDGSLRAFKFGDGRNARIRIPEDSVLDFLATWKIVPPPPATGEGTEA